MAGRKVGPYLGLSPDQSNVLGDVTGLAGGLLSNRAGTALQDAIGEALEKQPGDANFFARLLRNPATARQSQLGKPGTVKPILPSFLQKWTIPDWAIPKGEIGTNTNPGPFVELPWKIKPPSVEPELGSSENPGWFAKLPNTMPKQLSSPAPEPELGTPENPGALSKIPNRLTKAQMEALNEQKNSSPLPKGTVPGVTIAPNPRTPFDEEVPNYMASIPREQLSKLAKTGKPGAGKQLQQLGKTVIYVPPNGYPGPRK